MGKCTRTEALLWSIALPGFGQLLNGKWIKGLLLVGLEFWVNSKSKLNEVIIYSFHGEIEKSISQTDDQWLMFYPCIYMFGIWDAYKDAGGGTNPGAVFPFAFGAFFGTVGVIFSRDFLGAMWLGLIGLAVGIGAGILIQKTIQIKSKR